MGDQSVTISVIDAALAGYGLFVHGGFYPGLEDEVPALDDGAVAETLMLIGNHGPTMWQAFAAQPESGSNPLDHWCRSRIEAVAKEFGCACVFPFSGPPWLPFQRWALKTGRVFSSPIGPLIDPRYGLWHGYRGALLFRDRLALPEPPVEVSPCESCRDKPCMSTCPVGAIGGGAYDVPSCIRHISSSAGQDCVALGCKARLACPVGRDYRYPADQMQFHMAAFLRGNR